MLRHKLSVIIPIYNTSRFLERCIDSIINQGIPNIEILLIDDGSTDDSASICKEYASKNASIHYYYKQNGGLSSARNFGIDVASGDYITFVDSDDFLETDVYSIALSKIGDCDAAVFGSKTIDEYGRTISSDKYKSRILNSDLILKELVFKLKTAVWNKIFRRDFIGNRRFPENRIHGEDLVFILDCLASDTHFRTITKVGYNYVKHSGSITTSGFKASSFDEIWCKDVAADILRTKFGAYYRPPSHNWRFRARLNVCRKILKSGDQKYETMLRQLMSELRILYMNSEELELMNIIEYLFAKYIPKLYKTLIKYK